MYWKIGKDYNKKSIRKELTLFYAASAFIFMMAIGMVVYIATTHLLYKADYEFLADEVETIQYILDSPNHDTADLKQAIKVTPRQENQSLYRYFIRVRDQNEKTLIETPGMHAIFPEERLSAQKLKLLNKQRYLWYSNDDNQYLLIQAPISLESGKSRGSITVILDISYQHSVINDRKVVVGTIVFGSIIALLFGFWASRGAVKKVQELTNSVKAITASSLHHRVNPKDYPVELRELTRAFNSMLDSLECSVSRLKQFTGDLAHEIRTPVTNLVGETEIALNFAKTPDEFREVLTSNLEELNRMTNLIENILFLARADNPQLELNKQNHDISMMLSQLLDYYQPMADEKNITLSLSSHEELAPVNEMMFSRMLGNIISNALKYTNNSGEVDITLKRENDKLAITITDTGIGIDQKHLPNLFNRFYRADCTRTKATGGVGLGLAIVKSIVDLHKGTIAIQSETGKGTTVFIEVPAA